MPVAVRPKPAKQNHATAARTSVSPNRRRTSSGQFTVVESITRPAPQWLPWVMSLKRVTRPVAVISLVSVLGLYGLNVVMERQWGTRFASLENLQNKRNALVTLTERQKYQIPRNLEVAPKNYTELKQDRVLFIKPDSPRTFKSSAEPPRKSLLREDRLPVGY